ncbi:hypothetical protein ACU5AX_16200 [Sphingomonas sp. XXL09]|uniref:hypothetical protein n=1 Tax=Sphingomonas sp. XXL09 TaxID=3457787 RepID=UPI00406BC8BB
MSTDWTGFWIVAAGVDATPSGWKDGASLSLPSSDGTSVDPLPSVSILTAASATIAGPFGEGAEDTGTWVRAFGFAAIGAKFSTPVLASVGTTLTAGAAALAVSPVGAATRSGTESAAGAIVATGGSVAVSAATDTVARKASKGERRSFVDWPVTTLDVTGCGVTVAGVTGAGVTGAGVTVAGARGAGVAVDNGGATVSGEVGMAAAGSG